MIMFNNTFHSLKSGYYWANIKGLGWKRVHWCLDEEILSVFGEIKRYDFLQDIIEVGKKIENYLNGPK